MSQKTALLGLSLLTGCEENFINDEVRCTTGGVYERWVDGDDQNAEPTLVDIYREITCTVLRDDTLYPYNQEMYQTQLWAHFDAVAREPDTYLEEENEAIISTKPPKKHPPLDVNLYRPDDFRDGLYRATLPFELIEQGFYDRSSPLAVTFAIVLNKQTSGGRYLGGGGLKKTVESYPSTWVPDQSGQTVHYFY
ncbi:hypothetical protein KKC94_01065 [Patescibacteria group bacterium]|nr:hypothetical protein [Patescibacteria group bacterium]